MDDSTEIEYLIQYTILKEGAPISVFYHDAIYTGRHDVVMTKRKNLPD